jgi:hypothetical protein
MFILAFENHPEIPQRKVHFIEMFLIPFIRDMMVLQKIVFQEKKSQNFKGMILNIYLQYFHT